MKYQNWIETQNPISTVLYDVRNPPSDSLIATRLYKGPLLSVCGNPVLSLKSGGQTVTFLSYTFNAITSTISINLSDSS